MILACHNLNKSFGDHLIVRDGSFHVEDREKAALVGVNGAGKSTIFKMIVGELPLDEGDVILTKGKTLGYLAQHQNLDTTNTIYEELKTAKSDIIALEAQIRAIELELKSLSGEELTNRLNTYNRLMSEFESKNGYAYESEITGVLKRSWLYRRRILKTHRHPFRRSENQGISRKTFAHKTRYPVVGRTDQPPGSELHQLAGDVSSELSGCSSDCFP